MKSILVIVLVELILVSCLLLSVNATDRQKCNTLLHHCNQLKTQCGPDKTTIKSCCDLANFPLSKTPSGVYQIMVNCSCGSPFTAAVNMFCDMDTMDGGWIGVQRNKRSGKRTFYKSWKSFEEGFGDLNGEMWYGLKSLNCLTKTGQWELWVDFQFQNKTWSHLHYTQFKVGDAAAEYPLTIGGFTGITPTDPFATHSLNGVRFTTNDNDNDHA